MDRELAGAFGSLAFPDPEVVRVREAVNEPWC
jgi:hypothetical protein